MTVSTNFLTSSDGDWVHVTCAQSSTKTSKPPRFDFWTSKTARDTFREKYRAEFEELDERCEALTIEERCLGDFDVLAASRQS